MRRVFGLGWGVLLVDWAGMRLRWVEREMGTVARRRTKMRTKMMLAVLSSSGVIGAGRMFDDEYDADEDDDEVESSSNEDESEDESESQDGDEDEDEDLDDL